MPNYWIVGTETLGDIPDTMWMCNSTRYYVGTYGLAPFYGWMNYYNYTLRGQWRLQNGFWGCELMFEPDSEGPPLAPSYFTRVRAAVKGTTFGGAKLRVRGGVLWN